MLDSIRFNSCRIYNFAVSKTNSTDRYEDNYNLSKKSFRKIWVGRPCSYYKNQRFIRWAEE